MLYAQKSLLKIIKIKPNNAVIAIFASGHFSKLIILRIKPETMNAAIIRMNILITSFMIQ
ncbi:hypothetical protein AU253_18760 [Yersinia pestis]|nr:hypothetical protein AU253_18760 [Yersinia pestis]